jgi:hypothetical protein
LRCPADDCHRPFNRLLGILHQESGHFRQIRDLTRQFSVAVGSKPGHPGSVLNQ